VSTAGEEQGAGIRSVRRGSGKGVQRSFFARVFDSDRFKLNFTGTLDHLRGGFKIIGYVLMPEHFHLLIWRSDLADPSQVSQRPEGRTALFILKNLRRNLGFPWCVRILSALKLPPTVHHHAHYRVWQRSGYEMNIWNEKKRLEKLNYMHNNPVRGPQDWESTMESVAKPEKMAG